MQSRQLSFLVTQGTKAQEPRPGLAAEAGAARVAGVGRADRPLAEVAGEAGRAVAVPGTFFRRTHLKLFPY